MRVTTKGQVTIPQYLREKYGIIPTTEVDFIEEDGRIYLIKKEKEIAATRIFRSLRGVATVNMSTDKIMALTRDE